MPPNRGAARPGIVTSGAAAALLVAALTCCGDCTTVTASPKPPPRTEPEAAMVWPQPQRQVLGTASGYVASRAEFAFAAANPAAAGSDILQQGVARYRAIVFQRPPEPMSWVGRCDPDERQLRWPCPPPPVLPSRALVLRSINITLRSQDETLGLETSENYTLTVGFPNAALVADTVYGALRGLETFAQLVQPDRSIREQRIVDFPRFPFRATMVDTSRHWLPPALLHAHLDAMSYNKMNVLHMHISDMPSFPFVAASLPELSANGAFDSKHVYTPEVIAELVAYAKARGIRVIPEFDVPSHTYPSWDPVGVRNNNSTLLASCSSYPFGFLRVDRDSTYDFLRTLLGDVSKAFPDKVYNIGGDEMNNACWNQSADVAQFMQAKQFNGSQLTGYFAKKLFAIVDESMDNKTLMMWRPGIGDLVAPAETPASTIYDVYGNYNASATSTTRDGFRVVRSADYYLDTICTQDPNPKKYGTYYGYYEGFYYYDKDPVLHQVNTSAGGRPELVLGGKANMWGEHVDANNFMPRVWPRTSVLAERFWSAATVTDAFAAHPRLHEFRCKLTRRGIIAEPIGSLLNTGTGPYHSAFCQHDSDAFVYTAPTLPASSA